MTEQTCVVTITLPRWRIFVVKWYGYHLRLLVMFGMPGSCAVERLYSAGQWALRGAKVSGCLTNN